MPNVVQWICVSPNVVSVPNVHRYMLTNEVNHFGKQSGGRVRTVWFVHSCGMQIATVAPTPQVYTTAMLILFMYEVRKHQRREESSGMIFMSNLTKIDLLITIIVIKSVVFWDVTPCGSTEFYRHFGVTPSPCSGSKS
jgi:hypothetical protein